MILVSGATGLVGGEVIKQLTKKGIRFRAMAHDPDKAQLIVGSNIEVVHGDYDNKESLDVAMKGVDHLFLLSNQVEMENKVVDAAVRARVGHIVKLSVLGASPFSPVSFAHLHWISEKNIENSGIPFTFIRPNYFMQNLFMQAFQIASEGKLYASMGEGRLSLVDVRDVAAVSVAALTEQGHDGRQYELTGHEALSGYEMAQMLSLAIRKPVAYVNISIEDSRKAMLARGMQERRIEALLTAQEYFAKSYLALTTPWVDKIIGRNPISFDRFARDYVDIFSGRRNPLRSE